MRRPIAIDFDVYQMPEKLGGDWAFRVGVPTGRMVISDGYKSEEAARVAAQWFLDGAPVEESDDG